MNRTRGILCFGAAAAFFLLAVTVIPTLGLQNDETLFANGIYAPVTVADELATPAGSVPLMLVSYTGSLKTWLFALIFAFAEPSVWSIRLPVALLGAATVALFVHRTTREAGATAGVVAAGLLATDPAFLLTTSFDWGPVALQAFLGVAAASSACEYLRSGRRRWALLAGLAAGLALWNKALFLWTLGGLAAATLLVLPRDAWRQAPPAGWAPLAAGLAGGAWPLLLYNWRTAGGTFADNVGWELTPRYAAYKLGVLVDTLDASALFRYMINGDASLVTPMAGVFLALSAAAFAVPALRRQRPLLWTLAAFWVAYVPMFLGRGVGVGSHHVALLWPLPHLAIALAGAWWARGSAGRERLVLAGLAVMIAFNLRFVAEFRQAAVREGPSVIWTDAIEPLHARLESMQPHGVVFLDWGMFDPLRALGEGRLPLIWGADAFSTPGESAQRLVAEPGLVFVDHVDGKRVFPEVREQFDAFVQEAGMTQRSLGTVRDGAGNPTFELFQVVADAARRAPDPGIAAGRSVALGVVQTSVSGRSTD